MKLFKKILGVLILLLVFGAMVYAEIMTMGVKVTLIGWGIATGVAALITAGVWLIVGQK